MGSMHLVALCALTLSRSIWAQFGGMELPAGLSPRYHLSGSPQLAARQNNLCAVNAHSCLDVNANVCCSNDQYCMVGLDLKPACCAIGSDCGIKQCNVSQYVCAATATTSGIATVTTSCCERSCPTTSQFKCAASYGGGCCGYGSQCASGGACVSTVIPTTSAVVVVVPSGCTTSQFACPTILGGGCCNDGFSCTVSNNVDYCAAATGMATRTGLNGAIATIIPKPSSGISTRAKAGIGAGVAIGACLILGGLLWFCLAQRRRGSRQSNESETAVGPEMSQGSEAGIIRPTNERQTSDYFGPDAESGPFTTSATSPASRSPGYSRGVPSSPNSPGDISAPVEMDSRNHSNVTSPGAFEFSKTETTTHAVELP